MTIQVRFFDWWYNHFGNPHNAPTARYVRAEINAMQRRSESEPKEPGIAELVDKLPPLERDVLLLHVAHDKTYIQIAQERGMDKEEVLNILKRGYSAVRMQYKGFDDKATTTPPA